MPLAPIDRADCKLELRRCRNYLQHRFSDATLDESVFDRVLANDDLLYVHFPQIGCVGLLTERGFIEDRGDGDPRVTDDGRLLARIYSESDLLVAECLRTGVWKGLAPAELAAVLSAMVFETRGSDGPTPAHAIDMPSSDRPTTSMVSARSRFRFVSFRS